MTLDRRSFLKRTSIALAGGLVLGDAALEAFEQITHSKVFALGGLPESGRAKMIMAEQGWMTRPGMRRLTPEEERMFRKHMGDHRMAAFQAYLDHLMPQVHQQVLQRMIGQALVS